MISVFARLPPLSLFSSAYDLHFPTRTTWGGVPASLVVCLRDRCGFWAQLFEMLRNGTAVNHLVRANLLTARNCAASEIFEWNLVREKRFFFCIQFNFFEFSLRP